MHSSQVFEITALQMVLKSATSTELPKSVAPSGKTGA
jgi:hypothetical protein